MRFVKISSSENRSAIDRESSVSGSTISRGQKKENDARFPRSKRKNADRERPETTKLALSTFTGQQHSCRAQPGGASTLTRHGQRLIIASARKERKFRLWTPCIRVTSCGRQFDLRIFITGLIMDHYPRRPFVSRLEQTGSKMRIHERIHGLFKRVALRPDLGFCCCESSRVAFFQRCSDATSTKHRGYSLIIGRRI